MATSFMMQITVLALFFCVSAFFVDGRHVDHNGDLHRLHEPNNGDLVTQACVNASQHYIRPSHYISQEFCESALRSDKRSLKATHPRDLALIVLDLVQQSTADADAKLVGVMKQLPGDENDTVTLMRYCQVDYMVVATVLPMCRAMVQEYNPGSPRQPGDIWPQVQYFICANKLRDAANDCDVFDNDEDVGKEVTEVIHLTSLAKAMMEQMLGVLDTIE